jgi:NAD(P)-dependent dehydrogenase (short-subunit alcohol dehydrogenase family)
MQGGTAVVTLRDSVCIVTGAARGLGKAIAGALASQGARIALVDILSDELAASASELAAEGHSVLPVTTDVTDRREVSEMVRRVESDLGAPDVLVNNAGTFSVIGPVWEADPGKWFRDITVNVYGTFLCSHAIVGGMVRRKRGYVVNVASAGGVSDAHAYSTSYACSKTALLRLTEGLAKEAEEHGVRVFAIGPPAIRTAMTEFIATDPEARRWRPGFGDSYWHSPTCVTDAILVLLSGRMDQLTGRFIRLPVDADELMAQAERVVAEDLLTLRVRYLKTSD